MQIRVFCYKLSFFCNHLHNIFFWIHFVIIRVCSYDMRLDALNSYQTKTSFISIHQPTLMHLRYSIHKRFLSCFTSNRSVRKLLTNYNGKILHVYFAVDSSITNPINEKLNHIKNTPNLYVQLPRLYVLVSRLDISRFLFNSLSLRSSVLIDQLIVNMR